MPKGLSEFDAVTGRPRRYHMEGRMAGATGVMFLCAGCEPRATPGFYRAKGSGKAHERRAGDKPGDGTSARRRALGSPSSLRNHVGPKNLRTTFPVGRLLRRCHYSAKALTIDGREGEEKGGSGVSNSPVRISSSPVLGRNVSATADRSGIFVLPFLNCGLAGPGAAKRLRGARRGRGDACAACAVEGRAFARGRCA